MVLMSARDTGQLGPNRVVVANALRIVTMSSILVTHQYSNIAFKNMSSIRVVEAFFENNSMTVLLSGAQYAEYYSP